MIAGSGSNYQHFSVVGGNEKIIQKLCHSALSGNPPNIPRDFVHADVKRLNPGGDKRLVQFPVPFISAH